MNGFEFFSVPRIVFGAGTFERIGELSRELGQAALIVSNAGDIGDGGIVDRLVSLLAAAGIRSTCCRQRGEPQVEDVDRAVELARREAVEIVIGIGGGSAIDTAKAAAGLLANGGTPLDYLEVVGKGQKLGQPAAPWIAVPTTAGTGAEVTRNAVIGCPAQKYKASLRSPLLLARVALIDPELGVAVPRDVAACSGMDALAQLIESYTSNQAQPITDALALQGMSLAARALPRIDADPGDTDARGEMALAALLSGVTLTNVGLGAVHGFAAPLGAHLPIPHGAICAALLPHVMRANAAALARESPAHPVLRRYATIGRTITGQQGTSDAAAIDAGIHHAEQLATALRIPRLEPLGLTPEHIPELAALARRASSMRYNPIVLSDETLIHVLHQAR